MLTIDFACRASNPFVHLTPIVSAQQAEADRLGDALAELASRIHAATYELLVLIREFDACAGWNDGCLSCAHWLTPGSPTRVS